MLSMDTKLHQYNGTHALRSRKRSPVDFDPPLSAKEDVDSLQDSGSSSRSASTRSPVSPRDTLSVSNGANTTATDEADKGSPLEPSSGAQRRKASVGSSLSKLTAKDKRKRSRVTPEQLTHLERFFATDRSPTAAKRREISDLLGMHERQTQIWFQNRRAKAKLLDGKKRGLNGEWLDHVPDTPPQLGHGYESELQQLIHEDDPVTIIPCTDLSIGTWRRIASTSGKHDLVAYVCDTRRCLTWFIHSSGFGFKMEIPFEIISQTDYSATGPGQSLVSFTLSKPPVFYLETAGSRMGEQIKSWQTCTDWTEGMQATKVLRHDLIGSSAHLAHFLEELQRYRSNTTAASLMSTSESDRGLTSTPMQIPEPPLSNLSNDDYSDDYRHPPYLAHGRRRSSSGPPYDHDMSPVLNISNMPSSAPYTAGSNFLERRPYSAVSQPGPTGYDAREHQALPVPHHHQPIDGYTNVPISHSLSSRHSSFTSSTSPHSYPYDGHHSSIYKDQIYRDSAPPPTGSSQSDYNTPSPPLLTMPFHSQNGNGMSAHASLRHSHSSEEIPYTLEPPMSRTSASPLEHSHDGKHQFINGLLSGHA